MLVLVRNTRWRHLKKDLWHYLAGSTELLYTHVNMVVRLVFWFGVDFVNGIYNNYRHNTSLTFGFCVFQKISLQFKANLENVTNLLPDGDDFRWYLKVGECHFTV